MVLSVIISSGLDSSIGVESSMNKNGFRFFSFEISTGALSKNTYLELLDGDRKMVVCDQL